MKASSPTAAGASRAQAIRFIKYLLFSASLIPSLLAGAMAWSGGHGDLGTFLLVAFALFLGQAGGDYLYFYFTSFHTDQRDAHTKIFAGWKPLFTGTWLTDAQSLYAGIFCLGVDLLIGIHFFLKLGPTVLVLTAIGGAVAVFFTPLMLRGWKEPVVFLTFGPVTMLGVYFVLTGMLSLAPVIASFPIAFLVTLVAYLKSARFDVKGGDSGMVVLHISPATVAALLGSAFLSLAAAAAAGVVPPQALLGLLALPLAIPVLRRVNTESRIADYLWATVNSLLIFIAAGLLMALGYLIA